MNTGLQDAYNLGWKLALVIEKQAHPALLDSYQAERLPVAQRLLKTTDRAFKLVVSDSWLAGLFRTQILFRIAAFAMRREPVQRLAFRLISQIGITYRASRLSKSLGKVPTNAPKPGDRFPWLLLKFQGVGLTEDLFQKLDDACFNLVVVGQPSPPVTDMPLGAIIRVHRIVDDPTNRSALSRVGVPRQAFYLLRPDGHIGLCGTVLDIPAVTAYLISCVDLSLGPASGKATAP
jgi:hypothetical protein